MAITTITYVPNFQILSTCKTSYSLNISSEKGSNGDASLTISLAILSISEFPDESIILVSIIKKAKTGFNWDELKEKIMEWEPNRIIIGKPLNMDGTRSDFMEKVERFAKKLRSIIDIEIEFFDERLTSFEARQLDEDSEMIDDVAAKIILDSWLNNEYS